MVKNYEKPSIAKRHVKRKLSASVVVKHRGS